MKFLKTLFANPIFPAALLLITLAGSLISFKLLSPRQQVVLYYPQDREPGLEGELRIIARRMNREEKIETLLQELLLHPVSIALNPIVPEGVIIQSLIYNREDQILHVDFSRNFLIIDRQGSDYPEDQEIFQVLDYNIMTHFPYLKEINYTIDGMVPFSPLYYSE